MTLPQLVDVLAADWDGHEELAAEMRRKLPRYGNDDPDADRYAAIVSRVFLATPPRVPDVWEGRTKAAG